MKKVTRNVAIIFTVAWGVFLTIEIYNFVTFEPPPNEGGLGAYGGQVIRVLMMVIASVAVFCSGMLAIAMHKFRNAWYCNLGGVERASLVTAVLCNVLLYVSYFFLFFTNSILTVLVPIAWVISSFVCFCLLVGAFCQVPPQEISQ